MLLEAIASRMEAIHCLELLGHHPTGNKRASYWRGAWMHSLLPLLEPQVLTALNSSFPL